jgi:phosphoenolpyruvate---glycerone phosphotransferase subunit DhaK
MKELINSPGTVVIGALADLSAAHPGLEVDIENKVITRAPRSPGRPLDAGRNAELAILAHPGS